MKWGNILIVVAYELADTYSVHILHTDQCHVRCCTLKCAWSMGGIQFKNGVDKVAGYYRRFSQSWYKSEVCSSEHCVIEAHVGRADSQCTFWSLSTRAVRGLAFCSDHLHSLTFCPGNLFDKRWNTLWVYFVISRLIPVLSIQLTCLVSGWNIVQGRREFTVLYNIYMRHVPPVGSWACVMG
jgi:hypothetical protein